MHGGEAGTYPDPTAAGCTIAPSSAASARDLGIRSVRGAAVGLISQAGRVGIQLGSTAMLARLVTPEDYGLLAMAGSLIAFFGLFVDPGVSLAVVQAQRLTRH